MLSLKIHLFSFESFVTPGICTHDYEYTVTLVRSVRLPANSQILNEHFYVDPVKYVVCIFQHANICMFALNTMYS